MWHYRQLADEAGLPEVYRSDLLPNAAEVTEVAVFCHDIILACAQSGIVSGFPEGSEHWGFPEEFIASRICKEAMASGNVLRIEASGNATLPCRLP